MGNAFDKCIGRAPEHREELERRLAVQQDDDVFVQYEQIAQAFPAEEPHPNSFDVPTIDGKSVKAWAATIGWQVQPIDNNEHNGFPDIRFKRAT